MTGCNLGTQDGMGKPSSLNMKMTMQNS